MPEKPITEMPANVRDLYEKGVSAMQKSNFDYAVALFGQVVRLEPQFFDARQALRAAQHKRAAGRRSGGLFRRFLGSANSLTKGQLALRNNPAEALNIAEEALNDDPGNEAAHILLADAALALDLPRTAALSLEIAFKNKPKDRKLGVKLAEALSTIGQRDRAERILRDMLESDPHDAELNERLKNLLARRTLSEGGYEAVADGSGSYRDLIKDKDEAVRLEQESRLVKDADHISSLLINNESLLEKDPDNVRLLRETADLNFKKGNFERAIEILRHVIQVTGFPDPVVVGAIRDAELGRFDRQIAAIDPAALDAEAQRAALVDARTTFLIEEARSRAEANPTDLYIRFELGDLYLNAGRISEAIAELQKAQNNPNRRVPAMARLSQCFARRGMHDLAARKLQEALREKLIFDDEKKDLIYQLGSVFEKMGRKEDAIAQFKEIYEIDISYRDVAAKVDDHYASQS